GGRGGGGGGARGGGRKGSGVPGRGTQGSEATPTSATKRRPPASPPRIRRSTAKNSAIHRYPSGCSSPELQKSMTHFEAVTRAISVAPRSSPSLPSQARASTTNVAESSTNESASTV